MELEDVKNKYGDVPLTFKNYYKFSFELRGEAKDGTVVRAWFGGCSEDIYKDNIDRDDRHYLKAANDDMWNLIILEKDGEEIFNWSD